MQALKSSYYVSNFMHEIYLTGLEWNNPDLHDNYNFLGSWDLNDNDPDPMPNAAKGR